MTIEQQTLFDKLSQKRRKTAEALNDPSVSGFKKSVVDKYSDQAHFVYELLQNADDVGATEVTFELKEDKLIYKHNGQRHFSVSDVKDESDQDNLGDLNSITSIGNSSKKNSQKIGKFGVGFKAVFQYTNNPTIYEPVYKFRIDDLIVPVQIDNDFPGRKEGETVFEFPFNLKEKSKEKCFEEISYKLRNLNYPILFLKFLNRVSFKDKDGSGFYYKEIEETKNFEQTSAQKIKIINYDNGKETTEKLWLFSRLNEQELNYSVGFFIGTKEKTKKNKKGEEIKKISEVLRKQELPAFCYFSTQMATNLNFIIHAPFLLTDSREGIKAGEEHNHEQIQNLASLAADCFVYLKEINCNFINEEIFDLIPYKPDLLNGDNKNKLSLMPFYESILQTFSTEELLPTDKGFAKAEDAYIAYNKNLNKIFSNEKLAELYNHDKAQWAFPSFSPDSLEDDNEELYDYLENLTRCTYLHENDVKQYNKEYDDRYYYYNSDDKFVTYHEIFNKVTTTFIENQSIDWLSKFYGHIYDIRTYSDWFKDVAIFLDTEGKAAAAFDDEEHQILFLPSKQVTGYRTINSELLSKNQTKKLVELYGLREPSFKDEIYQIILPAMEGEILDYEEKFKKIFEYYLECNREESTELINALKGRSLILGVESNNLLKVPNELYLKTDALDKLFKEIDGPDFVDMDYYSNIISNVHELSEFFKKLGVFDGLELEGLKGSSFPGLFSLYEELPP